MNAEQVRAAEKMRGALLKHAEELLTLGTAASVQQSNAAFEAARLPASSLARLAAILEGV